MKNIKPTTATTARRRRMACQALAELKHCDSCGFDKKFVEYYQEFEKQLCTGCYSVFIQGEKSR